MNSHAFIDFSSNTQSFSLWAVRIGGRTDLSWWLVQKTWCWIKGTWICVIWKGFLIEYSDNWDRRVTDILRKQRGQAWLLTYVEGSLGTKMLREDTEVVQEWELKNTELVNGAAPDSEVQMWLSRKSGLRNREGWAQRFGYFVSRILRYPIWWQDKRQKPRRGNGWEWGWVSYKQWRWRVDHQLLAFQRSLFLPQPCFSCWGNEEILHSGVKSYCIGFDSFFCHFRGLK